jgi:hypothetical protein
MSERQVLHDWWERGAMPNRVRVVRGEWQGMNEPPEKMNDGDAWLEVVDACDQWLGIDKVDYSVANEIGSLAANAAALRARVAELEGALAQCAIPLEALNASECDEAGWALSETMKTEIRGAALTIRRALLTKETP